VNDGDPWHLLQKKAKGGRPGCIAAGCLHLAVKDLPLVNLPQAKPGAALVARVPGPLSSDALI
jgi:hypothetical protein